MQRYGGSGGGVSVVNYVNNTNNQLDGSNESIQRSTTENRASGKNKNKQQRERKLAMQMIIINMLEFASCVFFVLLSLCNVIASFNGQNYYVRQLFRISNLICQAFIPLVALIYSPVFKKFTNVISAKLRT
jgi:dipeptide/tripeptide permease